MLSFSYFIRFLTSIVRPSFDIASFKVLTQKRPYKRCELIGPLLHEQMARGRQKFEPLSSGNIFVKPLAPSRPEVRVFLPPYEQSWVVESAKTRQQVQSYSVIHQIKLFCDETRQFLPPAAVAEVRPDIAFQ